MGKCGTAVRSTIWTPANLGSPQPTAEVIGNFGDGVTSRGIRGGVLTPVDRRNTESLVRQGIVRIHGGRYGQGVPTTGKSPSPTTELPTTEGVHRETTRTNQPHRPARQWRGSATPRSPRSGQWLPRVSDGDRS